MEIRYIKHYSHSLQRDMEFKVYGHTGKPVMFIPCQQGRFWDFESFHMIDYWAKWIEAGLVTVYAVDCIDGEAYADLHGDPRRRSEQHERWYHYVVDEFVPTIQAMNRERTGRDDLIMTFGCSMGAMHAGNLFFRRPDLFGSVLALSGMYDPHTFFPGYVDDILYNNSPNLYLANMPDDHYYIDMYNNRKGIICVGQGAWEDDLKASTFWLRDVLAAKNIHGVKVEVWGHDVNHDWPWWYRQVEYYVPQLLD
ncbi:MAG: esterase family protein [Oscillospiraceae bacterium]|nr:esterase family protein [Oscillospiraceae bacterium]